MAFEMLFLDGFDHYATADLPKKWPIQLSTGTAVSTFARTGGQAINFGASGARALGRPLGMDCKTVVMGFAVYFGLAPETSIAPIAGLYGGGNAQVLLLVNADLTVQVRRSNNNNGGVDGNTMAWSDLLGSSTATVAVGAWNHLEWRTYIHDTAGETEVRLNGVTILTLTGVNTRRNSDTVNTAYISGAAGGTGMATRFDDVYVRGSATLEPGGFFGDCKVLTRNAIGPGSAAQLTSSSGNPNWQNVNTALPDLATYNHSLTPGDKDLYDFATLNDPGAIRAVQVNLLANKSDAGLRLIKPRSKSGATEQAGDAQALSTDERYHTQSWEMDPNTGAAWEHAALDNAEFGASVDE